MNMEIINKIEMQISELENRLKRANDFCSNLIASIKNIRKERDKSKDEANVVAGALQAYKGVLSELKSSEKMSEPNELKDKKVKSEKPKNGE